jgi:hypothetical protein
MPPLAKRRIGLRQPNIWVLARDRSGNRTGSWPVDKWGAIPEYPADD